jgi:ABC-type multidrug transport system ATPase subunit
MYEKRKQAVYRVDEPTAALDPKERIAMRNMIAKLAKGRIVLLATHIVSDIECISNYVILMQGGQILCCKAPSKLIEELSVHSSIKGLEDVYLYYFDKSLC